MRRPPQPSGPHSSLVLRASAFADVGCKPVADGHMCCAVRHQVDRGRFVVAFRMVHQHHITEAAAFISIATQMELEPPGRAGNGRIGIRIPGVMSQLV